VAPRLASLSLSLYLSLSLFLLAREPCVPRRSRRAPLSRLQAAGGTGVAPPPPAVLKFGLNHITTLIENKKAKLVVIASDVSPVELVVWLPALCRKFGVPYAVVNNKGRLGALVHMKTATALALTAYKKEDEAAFGKIVDLANAKFKDNADVRRKWGGGIMGMKTQKRLEIRERLLQCVARARTGRAARGRTTTAAPTRRIILLSSAFCRAELQKKLLL
jgi:large subunit ribosomal protein L7Ae